MQIVGPGHLVSGRYRLLSQIGGGGMGAVWLARDELLGRQVAIKQVLPPNGVDPDLVDQQRQRALREGRIAARLSHPHVVSVYDVALESGQPWLVMEYLPSRSLAQIVYDDGLLRIDQAAQIGAQLADALAATHAAGIVHRDVKPANVLIGEGPKVEGLVKITDFGISHAIGDVTLTQTGQLTGTPAFLAPEVAQGAEMSEASDVFSLGATLYTCLEGQPPFGTDDNALRLLHRVAAGSVRPPARAGALTAALMRMLADDPAARPSMTEVRDRLVEVAAGRDGDPTTVLLARTSLRPAPGRTRTAALPGAAAPVGPTPPPPLPDPADPPRSEEPSAPAEPPPHPREPAPATLAGPPPGPAQPRAEPLRSAPAGITRERRRRSPPLIAALVAFLLLVGGGVAWLASRPGGDATAADPSVSSAAPSTEPSAEETQETAEPAPSTSESAPAPPPADPAAEAREVLEQYYALLPGDTEGAYALTGPTLQSRAGYDYYRDFFGRWSEVSLLDLRDVTDQGDRITATTEVEFVRPGERLVETHAVTFVRGADGRLLIDLDVLA